MPPRSNDTNASKDTPMTGQQMAALSSAFFFVVALGILAAIVPVLGFCQIYNVPDHVIKSILLPTPMIVGLLSLMGTLKLLLQPVAVAPAKRATFAEVFQIAWKPVTIMVGISIILSAVAYKALGADIHRVFN